MAESVSFPEVRLPCRREGSPVPPTIARYSLYFTSGSHDGKDAAAYHMLGDDCQTRGISVKPVDASEYEGTLWDEKYHARPFAREFS